MAINRRRFLALPAIGIPAMVVGKRLGILAWLKSYFSTLRGASLTAENIPKGLVPVVGVTRGLIRVLVADSNQTQSQLLSSALQRQPGLRVSCCSNRLSDCLKALQSAPADVVVLSDEPSNHDQLIEVLRGLHSSYPHLRLILMLDSYDRNLVVNAMRAGVRGLFCRASQPFRALCRCIAVVYQGQYWANTEQMGYVIDALSSGSATRVINAKGERLLTPREEQIVNLVAEGIGNREIANQLGIKENTFKKSLLRTYDKLGVSNRVELVLYTFAHRGAGVSSASKRRMAQQRRGQVKA